MTLDIVAVAFGFESLPPSSVPPVTNVGTRVGRDVPTAQVAPPPPPLPPQGGSAGAPPPPPPYALHTAGSAAAELFVTDSLPFIALKQSLHERCPQGSLSFNRHWCVQVEGTAESLSSATAEAQGRAQNNGGDVTALTLQATFRRADFFIAAWTASLGTLLDTPATRLALDHAAAIFPCSTTPDASNKRCWDTLRQALPPQILALRLWATSLPAVLKHTRMTGGGNAGLKGSFASVSSVTSPLVAPSSPKGALLKFTQATLSIPIRELVHIASSSGSTCKVGDGADFVASRVLRIDILRSAMNEMALLMLGGGAAPSEETANDPSVAETVSYRSSIGVVGLQIQWVPGSTVSTPPLSGKTKSSSSASSDGPSDEEPCGVVTLAKDLVLEIQFLTQTSSNAGKKAIEAAVREFLPASFFEEPSSLLIGVANQHDGSVHNVTLRSPSLGSAKVPPTPPIKAHASWSAAVTGTPQGTAVTAATPRTANGAATASLTSPRSFPGLGPSVALKAHAPSSNSSASSKSIGDGKHSKSHSPSVASPTNATPRSALPTAAATAGAKKKIAADAAESQQSGASDCQSPASAAGCPTAASSTSSDCSIKRKSSTRKTVDPTSQGGAAALPPLEKRREASVDERPTPSNTSGGAPRSAASPDKALATLREDVKRQSHILLTHSIDLAILEAQFEDLLNGRDSSSTTPTTSTVLRASRNTSIGSSGGVSSVTNIPSILSTAPLIAPHILDHCSSAVKLALSALRDLVVTPETRSLAKSDLEFTVGPNSKMLKGALESGCAARLEAYRSFQKRQKNLLMEGIASFGVLFAAADIIVEGLEKQLRLLNLEEQEWRSSICDRFAAVPLPHGSVKGGVEEVAAVTTSLRRGGQGKKNKKSSAGSREAIVVPPTVPPVPQHLSSEASAAEKPHTPLNAAGSSDAVSTPAPQTQTTSGDGHTKAGASTAAHSASPSSQSRSGSSTTHNKPPKPTGGAGAGSLHGGATSQRNAKLLTYGVGLAIAFAIAIVGAAWA